MIDPTARISKNAIIHESVSIGPYSIIGNVIIKQNCIIHSHVTIGSGVRLEQETEIFPFSFIGKPPKGAACAREPHFEERITVGQGCSLGPHAIIYYDVDIGNNTLVGDGASIREKCKIGDKCILSRYVTINYNTTIGNETKIMDNSHITGNSKIGKNVFISTLVGFTNDNLIRAGFSDHIIGPTIEDGAIIGVGASLLPNITVKKGSIIAAGAVVTRSVDEYTLGMGIPTRVVKCLETASIS